MDNPILYIVVPCYNEEEVLKTSIGMFTQKLKTLIENKIVNEQSKILFVDDGSKDITWQMISEASKIDHCIKGISLSRNRGHQNALLAGLMEAKQFADITISIDCDGQDDINAMDEMIAEYKKGCDVVYGVRNNRKTDSIFKRSSASIYYRILKWLGADIVYNHADYRLVSSRVLNELEKFEEVNIFLRGMFPLVGFKSTSVYYKREKRIAGKTHYSLHKMLHLAWDGVTSLSIKPIRMVSALGGLISFLSFIMIIWVLISYINQNSVPGWATQIICTCLIGGIQLVSLGIIGEYVGKIYLETKKRPKYIIMDKTK